MASITGIVMARTYQFRIGLSEAGLRLDHYLAHRLPTTLSRAMIQRTIRAGFVTIGGQPVKAHAKLHQGDTIVAEFAQLPGRGTDTVLIPQPIPLEVLHEDAHLLVVNKPAGLVTHPAPGHWVGTLVNAILWHLERGQGAGDGGQGKTGSPTPHAPRPTPLPSRAGIVHRLDKDTSGLLLVAKTEAAHAALSKQLKARTIRRRYVAIVESHVPLNIGTVNAPIGRHQIHRKEMTIRHLGGRQAVTHYRVLKRMNGGQGAGDGGQGKTGSPTPHAPRPTPLFAYTALEVSLDTGRTHQIRVHMAHLGYPVLGDLTYGRHLASFWRAIGVGRQLLHAYQLSFQHPVTRQLLTFTAPLPDDLALWIDADVINRLSVQPRGSP